MNKFKEETKVVTYILIGIPIGLICTLLPVNPVYQIFIGLISCIIVGLITTEEK